MVVASMHGKHYVMKPLIKQYLNIDTVIVPNIDTDEFGTFSGEVDRRFDAVTTLRKKILKGLKVSGESLGIGNEGSFGPHPNIPFLQVDLELVMMIDLERDLEIIDSVISTETVHAQQDIHKLGDLLEFTERVKFPSHGIILKQMRDGKMVRVQKGILSWEILYSAWMELSAGGHQVVAETDMRGYMNPTRMKIIERATEALMKKVTNTCPECQWPGFGVADVKGGLPCEQCGGPTRLPMVKVYHCKNCSYTDERFYTDGRKADPQYCDHCNP